MVKITPLPRPVSKQPAPQSPNLQSPNLQSPNLPISTLTPTAALLLSLLLSLFAIAPLFYPGYIQTHSGFVPLWNVADLRANGGWGWLPHIATSFDPLRSPGLLPYYLAALLPVPPVTAIKLVMGGSLLAGSVGMFLWLKSWLGQAGALVAALVYVYLPHQLATLYVRGAWGESLFLGLLPWAILAATYLVTSPRWVLLPVAAAFWLLLGLSHLGLTIWALFFISGLLLTVHLKQSLLPGLAALSGTVLATLITFSQAAPAESPVTLTDHFLYPFQLFSAYWGFGASRPGWADGLPLQLGLASLGLSFLAIILWQRQTQISRTDRRLLFFAITPLALIGLQLGLLSFIWRSPLALSLTYPWQLLSLTGLCLAVLAGAALWLEAQLSRLPLLAGVILLVTLSSYGYLEPQFIQAEEYNAPQAILGADHLLLLDHDLAVVTSADTAGLELGQTELPLAVAGPLQAHDTLLLKVTWQPLQTFDQDLKVFVHLVDPNGNVIVQFDGQPQAGQNPTSQWVPGTLIEDTYPLTLPAESPPGPYRLYVGLYDEATFERLPVPGDNEGRVILKVE